MLKKIPAYIWISSSLGILALLVMLVEFAIQISYFKAAPNEIFFLLGAAFGGPWGVFIMLVIYTLGRVNQPVGELIPDALIHLIGLIPIAILYKKIIYAKMKMPLRMLGWVVLVVAYYWVLIGPISSVAVFVFNSNTDLSLYPFMREMLFSFWPEMLGTIMITTLVMMGLPERWRKPLW